MKDRYSPAGELVRRFYNDVWNRRDEGAAREILDPGLKFRASLGPESLGVGAFIDYLRLIHDALSDYHCVIDDLIEIDTRASARMTFSGRHTGVLLGVQPTGRELSWCGAAFFTTNGRRIIEVWVLGDLDAVKRQLGRLS